MESLADIAARLEPYKDILYPPPTGQTLDDCYSPEIRPITLEGATEHQLRMFLGLRHVHCWIHDQDRSSLVCPYRADGTILPAQKYKKDVVVWLGEGSPMSKYRALGVWPTKGGFSHGQRQVTEIVLDRIYRL